MAERGKEVRCPWCNELVIPKIGFYQGQYGRIREQRCPECNKLILTRLEGTPLDIVK